MKIKLSYSLFLLVWDFLSSAPWGWVVHEPIKFVNEQGHVYSYKIQIWSAPMIFLSCGGVSSWGVRGGKIETLGVGDGFDQGSNEVTLLLLTSSTCINKPWHYEQGWVAFTCDEDIWCDEGLRHVMLCPRGLLKTIYYLVYLALWLVHEHLLSKRLMQNALFTSSWLMGQTRCWCGLYGVYNICVFWYVRSVFGENNGM